MTDAKTGLVEVDGIGSIVVIEAEVLTRRDEIVAARRALGAITEANVVEADALVGRQARHDRDVEERRKRIKAPFLAAGRFIDDAAADATIGDRELVASVARIRREIDARRAAEQAERERIAAEAEAKARAAERERIEAEVALAALEVDASPDDAPVIESLRAEVEARAEVMHAEVIEAGGRAWLASASAGSYEAPRITTGSRRVQKLEIFDVTLIPHQINGVELLEPKRAAITRMLKSGIPVAGCRMVDDDAPTAGRR